MRTIATSTKHSIEYDTIFPMYNHFSIQKSPFIDLISQSQLNNRNVNRLSIHKKYFINLFRIKLKKKIDDDKLYSNNYKYLPTLSYFQKSNKSTEKNSYHHKIKSEKKIIKINNDSGKNMKTLSIERLLHSKSNKNKNRNNLLSTKVKHQINNTYSNIFGFYKKNFNLNSNKNYSITKAKYKSVSTENSNDVHTKYKGMSCSEVKRIFLKKKLNKDLFKIKNLKKEIKFHQNNIINMFQSISDKMTSIYEHENVHK